MYPVVRLPFCQQAFPCLGRSGLGQGCIGPGQRISREALWLSGYSAVPQACPAECPAISLASRSLEVWEYEWVGGKLDPLLNLNIWRQKGTHIESHLLLLEAKYKNTERFKSRKPRDQIFAPERTFWVNLKQSSLEVGRLEVVPVLKAGVGSQARGEDDLKGLELVGMRRKGH